MIGLVIFDPDPEPPWERSTAHIWPFDTRLTIGYHDQSKRQRHENATGHYRISESLDGGVFKFMDSWQFVMNHSLAGNRLKFHHIQRGADLTYLKHIDRREI